MITVYAFYNFPPFVKGLVRDMRVMWALEELDLPYQTHWLDFAKGEQRDAPNRLVNPFGKVPGIENGALHLFESAAIVLYLYENAGKAPQDAHARAELNQWCFAALNTVEPVFFEVARWNAFWKDRPGRELRYPELLGQAAERLDDLQRALGAKPYLLGNDFGPADILMTTVLDFSKDLPEVFGKHAGIRAYRERCHGREAYKRALARHGEGPAVNAA
jgi:glutathione S-transferase